MKANLSIVCDKCGKPMPVDIENSTANFTSYKSVCECGGKAKPLFMQTKKG